MKAAGRKPDASAAAPQSTPPLTAPTRSGTIPASQESEDIAKLLRALNEDLKDDPTDEIAEDEEELPENRGLPFGKIALALLAAAGIGAAVVMLGQESPQVAEDSAATQAATQAMTQAATATAGSQIATAPPASVTRAPEPLIARAPAIPPTPTTAAPPPPPAAATLNPPPALKAPEPPPLPAVVAAPPQLAPTVQRTITQPAAQLPASQPPAVQPQPSQPVALPPPAPAPVAPPATATPPVTVARAPEPPPPAPAPPPRSAEPARVEPPKPAPVAKSEPGELQAMLAPRDAAKPAARTPQRSKPEAPAASAEAPATTVPDGRYAIQLGSFQQAANAEALVGRLKANGFQAYAIDWVDASQRSWRVVRVGGYPDTAAARRAGAEVKSKLGIDSNVVSTR